MYGYLEGWSDTDAISYCPLCGERVYVHHADGTASCESCGERFGVIVVSESEEV